MAIVPIVPTEKVLEITPSYQKAPRDGSNCHTDEICSDGKRGY